MFIVKTSPRALLFALLPLVLVQGVLFTMALAGSQTNPPMVALPPPDLALGLLALRIGLDALGLTIGHFIARDLGIGSRAAYALIGGVASAAGYAVALHQGLTLLPPYHGAVVTAGILPTLGGMMAGFLYGQFAGRESLMRPAPPAAADTPPDVPGRVRPSPPQAAPPAPPPPTAFDGPVQVRTSLAAMFIASLVPAFLVTVLFFMLTYSLVSGVHGGPGEPLRFVWSQQLMALALPAQMFLTTALATMIPSAIFAMLAHGIARALRRSGGLEYAGIGALTGVALGIALIPFGGWPSFPFTGVGFLILPLAVCGAIMMAVYRRFAGLEPRSLPEPVLAREPEALVPEDHPSRRSHAVVLNG